MRVRLCKPDAEVFQAVLNAEGRMGAVIIIRFWEALRLCVSRVTDSRTLTVLKHCVGRIEVTH